MQKSPVQPGVQWQAPSSALQLAPLWQLHVWKQAEPQNPDGQACEQSLPIHPGKH